MSQPARAITAAAKRIGGPNTGLSIALLNKARQAGQAWQTLAWDYYETIPEIHFAHEFLGNCVGRMRLFPQYQANPTDPPIPLDPEDENLDEETRKAAAVASATLDRLNSSVGGRPGLQTALGLNAALVGETYLWGHVDEEAATGETWEALSTREVKVSGSEVTITDETGEQQQRTLDVTSEHFIRIWHRHPGHRVRADSAMRPLLSTCEELLLLSRSVRAVATSRLAGAGILKVPDELSFVAPSQDGGEPTDQGADDPLLETLLLNMTTPIQDPDSAAAVVPMMVKGPAEALAQLGHLLIERPFDPLAMQLREECVTRLARGLDVPPEILLGMADANHWTAWQVEEQTFKAHVEPLVDLVCDGLTVGFLQPILQEAGLANWSKITVGKDPSALVGHPNEFPEAVQMHTALAVSDAFLRAKGGAGDSDAPDEEEYARRLAQKSALPPEIVTVLLRLGEVLPQLESIAGPGGEGTPPVPPVEPTTPEVPASPETTEGGPPDSEPAVVGAARRDLGAQLAALDRALIARIMALAETTLQRAVEIVGARVVRAVNGSAKLTAVREQIRDVSLDEVAWVLGRDAVRALGVEENAILEGHLVGAEEAYRQAVARTRREARRLAQAQYGDPPEEFDEDRWEEEQDEHDGAGWLLLLGGLTALATATLWDPRPEAPPLGEQPVEARVPASMVRESLAVAGGATAAPNVRPEDSPAGEVALGDGLLDYLNEAYGATILGWRWVYGDPSARTRSFDPHADLDGVEFTTWDDPLLANADDFPPVPYYQPQDHNGCLCQAEILLPEAEG